MLNYIVGMIRITTKKAGGRSIVQIDGALRSEVLGELVGAVADVELPITLDLTNLRSADSESADALVKMAEDAAEVTGASPYILLLLEKHGLDLEK